MVKLVSSAKNSQGELVRHADTRVRAHQPTLKIKMDSGPAPALRYVESTESKVSFAARQNPPQTKLTTFEVTQRRPGDASQDATGRSSHGLCGGGARRIIFLAVVAAVVVGGVAAAVVVTTAGPIAAVIADGGQSGGASSTSSASSNTSAAAAAAAAAAQISFGAAPLGSESLMSTKV